MKAEDIVKGSLVIIKHSKEGGEVIETNRTDGRFLVKVARMKVNATGCKTQIVNVLADADDLEPIKKQKGVVIHHNTIAAVYELQHALRLYDIGKEITL